MENQSSSENVGQAWLLYRNGQHDTAARGFEQVLNQDPSNIDAHFGLGLVLRTQGNHSASMEHFDQAKRLVADALVGDPTSDRLEILERMVQQRINELKIASR